MIAAAADAHDAPLLVRCSARVAFGVVISAADARDARLARFIGW